MAEERVCPVCGLTTLSRYNSEPLCGACMRVARGEVRDDTVRAPTWLWDSPAMRRALADMDLATCVTIVRAACGLSQLELANLVGWSSQSVVSRIESGSRNTLYDIRELLAFADAIDMPREALLPLILGREDAILERESDITRQEGDLVNRRAFDTMALGLAISSTLPDTQVPARVDNAHLRYLRATLEGMRSQDHSVGGAAVLPQALRYFARARRMLDESDYTSKIGRELLVVTADLGLVCGWLAYDSGNQGLARRLYGETELLAGSVDHNELSVHLYANMTQQSTHLARVTDNKGFAREALRFARRAADAARHEPSPRLHALISIRQASAYACLGDEIAFRSSINAARRELDRGTHDTDPEWTQFVTESEVTGMEAMGKARLGDPTRAASLYRIVIDDRGRSRRDRAYYHARLAGCLVQKGDHDEAIHEGLAILPAIDRGSLTSVRTLNELKTVRSAAESRSAEFCARFDSALETLRAS